MGENGMPGMLATLWQKILDWLSVAGSAHVVDDGCDEKKDRQSKRPPPKLHLEPRQN